MLEAPKHGWATFTYRDFSCTPSYLTDVPMDLLDCLISLYETGFGGCLFDTEGSEYELFLSQESVLVVCHEDKRKILDLTPENYLGNKEKNRMAKELIFDIESNLNDWVYWDYMDNDTEETAVRKEILRTKIEKLKKLIKQTEK